MSLIATERATYDEMFAIEQYGEFSPGERYADLFASLATSGSTVLDAGCGTGKGSLALQARGFSVSACDLVDARIPAAKGVPLVMTSLWHDLGAERFDYVYCCDVLEHIPPEFTMLVVRNLLAVATRGVFLSIALVPDHFGVWVGKPLHQTVQPYTWWLDRLKELGDVVDARDLLNTATFLLRPKR